ncbi:MAG: glycerophosphodiester phosphodiesterase family protein [Candidatus Andeanibacterium colombiense]|uniref:Glycerophosphodiester phosphodiesterase family protein n=1 Tax=Candidatus Andeanibacterium colombiense TaxID=3121345 RepID=A0AAJ5X336_9SPHN|nr:MAG: glycerophosphodiester phosphodiesterase family protein [Sphingomonadaceae bacterium]
MRSLLWRLLDNWLSPAPDKARVGWLARQDYAHRGLHDGATPENSLGAFTAAIAQGIGIECDVQRSGDGQAMVFHDWELDRLTGERGPVARRNAAALGQIMLTGGSDRIPSLREVLGLVRSRVPLLIEIKSKRDYHVAGSCLAVLRVLEGYKGPHAVMSFDPRVGQWFAKHAPRTVRGLVVSEEHDRGIAGVLRRHLWLWLAKPDFLAYDVRDFPSAFAQQQRARGLPITSWTVNSPAKRVLAAEYADAPIAEGAGVERARAL